MSDKPISVGDLVSVVRPLREKCKCTGSSHSPLVKWVFRVDRITNTASHCPVCKHVWPFEQSAWPEGEFEVYALYRLKRIPPMSELESSVEGDKLDIRVSA